MTTTPDPFHRAEHARIEAALAAQEAADRSCTRQRRDRKTDPAYQAACTELYAAQAALDAAREA